MHQEGHLDGKNLDLEYIQIHFVKDLLKEKTPPHCQPSRHFLGS